MRFLKLYILLFFSTVFLNQAKTQGKTTSPTPETIINNAISALGGREYLQSVKTLYSDASTEMEGRQVHFVVKEMLPNKGSFEIIYNNNVVYKNWFNGEEGFELTGNEKKKADPQLFADKKYKKNIFDELDYLDPSLWKLELIGEEKVNNEDCYKIKATLANGAVKILYYSKITFYLLREDKIADKENNTFETTLFNDYKRFGQLNYYSRMITKSDGKEQILLIGKLLQNEQITDQDFK